MLGLCGIPIIVDDIALCETKWEFPKHRFVEYEPKDERACRALGIGQEVRVPQLFQFRDKMICNTPFLKLLEKETNDYQRKEDCTCGYGWLYS